MTAAAAVRAMNPEINVHPLEEVRPSFLRAACGVPLCVECVVA